MATDTKTETDNVKTEYSSIFGANDHVGDIGILIDGTYNVHWVIYSISGNTYQLFPLRSLAIHQMNPTDTNTGGYEASDMYTFIHNTILPKLRRSGLNIVACDLVSENIYNDICSKTSRTSATIASRENFWLADPYSSDSFYFVISDGVICYGYASDVFNVRPLITVVK